MKLLVASQNMGKAEEIRNFLVDVEVLTIDDIEVEETGETLEENAILKARAYGNKTGLITLADDSGFIVEALDGRPGVFSKRYGKTDKERVTKLLGEMKDVENRRAYFSCFMALYNPKNDRCITVEGKVDGFITAEPKGENGFGYDPIFYSDELGKTFAQATLEEKNSVSHRGRALEKIKAIIGEVV